MTLCVLVMVIDLTYYRHISLKPDHVENITLKRQLQLYSHASGMFLCGLSIVLYPDSGISMDEEIVLGDLIWSYFKAEL